jgi:hypothetical protein
LPHPTFFASYPSTFAGTTFTLLGYAQAFIFLSSGKQISALFRTVTATWKSTISQISIHDHCLAGCFNPVLLFHPFVVFPHSFTNHGFDWRRSPQLSLRFHFNSLISEPAAGLCWYGLFLAIDRTTPARHAIRSSADSLPDSLTNSGC